MGLFSWLTGSVIGGTAKAVKDVAGIFTEFDEEQAKRAHVEDIEKLRQFAAEFHPRSNRTRWDSLVDGLNRLPRPTITFSVLGFFVYAVYDPPRFAQVAAAFALVPNGYWGLLTVIIGFYFGSRHILKAKDFEVSREALARAAEVMNARKPIAVSNDHGQQSPTAIGGC